MPRKLRCHEIDLTQTFVYHVVSRCVRSIPLLHTEDDSRKELCMRYLQLLSETTAIEIAGFSLMDNHLHLLLRVDVEQAHRWSKQEVAVRWLTLHPTRNGYFQPVESTPHQIGELIEKDEWVDATREKLCSIGQFMKEFKQRVAQASNRQDKITGAFWEGRYKITAVRDETQLLTTMAYIDLNPFAANVGKVPEESRYTSLQGRIDRDQPLPNRVAQPAYEMRGEKQRSTNRAEKKHSQQVGHPFGKPRRKQDSATRQPSSAWLVPLDPEYAGRNGNRMKSGNQKPTGPCRALLPGLTVRHYLMLVDDVARFMRNGKKRLAKGVKPILERLSLTCDAMADAITTLQTQWQPYLQQEGHRVT